MWKCEKCGSFSDGKFCGFCGGQKPEGTPEAAGVFVNKPTSADDEKTVAAVDSTKGIYTDPAMNETGSVPSEAPVNAAGETSTQQMTAQEPAAPVSAPVYPQNGAANIYSQPQMPDVNNGYNPYAGAQNGYNTYGYDSSNYGGIPTVGSEAKPRKEKSGTKALWIICAVLLAILLGLGGFIAYTFISEPASVGSDRDDDDRDDKKDEEEEETEEEEEEDNKIKKKVNKLSDSDIEDIITEGSSYTDFNIYVKNLTTGYEYGYNDDEEVLASAMSQIVILDTLSEMADNDDVDIDTEEIYFTYTPNGKYAPDSPGQNNTYVTIRDCIEDVATYGDNNKSNQLIDFIAYKNGSENGLEVINDRMSDLGYDITRVNKKTTANANLSHNPNVTCAYEIGNIFENLITNGGFGSRKYMTGIFRCVNINGEVIGLKNHIPEDYSSGCVNAFNSQTTNNVAFISDGKTELVVVLLANTDEDKTGVENNDLRDSVQASILEYILEKQFEK